MFSIMNLSLGVRVLMGALEALAKSKGFTDVPVLPKVNAQGELGYCHARKRGPE
jgi:hypothetical protein